MLECFGFKEIGEHLCEKGPHQAKIETRYRCL